MSDPTPGDLAGMQRVRVVASSEALYGKPRTARKRRRCDSHLSERHWIEPGDLIVWSALPPNSNDIGNLGWWHAAYCIDCAPEAVIAALVERTGVE